MYAHENHYVGDGVYVRQDRSGIIVIHTNQGEDVIYIKPDVARHLIAFLADRYNIGRSIFCPCCGRAYTIPFSQLKDEIEPDGTLNSKCPHCQMSWQISYTFMESE